LNKLFVLVSTVLCLHWRYLAVLVSYGCDIVIYVLFLNSHIVLNRKFSQIKYTIRLVRFGQFGLPVAVRPRWPVGSISSMFCSNHSPKMHRCKLGAWDRNVRGLGQILHDQLHWLDVPDRVLFKLVVTFFNHDFVNCKATCTLIWRLKIYEIKYNISLNDVHT